jgi:hypothetical protein
LNIPDSLKRSLLGPLGNIERILTDDDPTNHADACAKLDDFIASVNDKVTGREGGIIQEQADDPIGQAEAIKDAIRC